MVETARIISAIVSSVIGILVMVVLATFVFYITMFVVSTGARVAGFRPSADFVVLSASLIVVAVILTGGMTPRYTEVAREYVRMEDHDPTYD